METSFANGFADFLEERLGDALFALRKNNKDYRNLSDEYAALLNGQYNSLDEYQQAITKMAEINVKLGDIQKHYLFLAGMREHAKIKDALYSENFENLFIG